MVLVSRQEYTHDLERMSFEELVGYSAATSHFGSCLLFSLRQGLQKADAQLPRKPTRKAAAAADELRQKMAKLKADLQHTMPVIEDWAESKVAMLGKCASQEAQR